MARLEKIKVGDVLYDVHSERMGNTTMRRFGIWECYVREVHPTYALISWNGNPPREYFHGDLRRLRLSKPKKMNGHLEGCRGYHGMDWGRNCTCKEIEARAGK